MDLSATHLHLLLNHVPTVGFVIGLGLFIVKNYEGDVMNFDMAAEMSDGILQVVTNDDVAVENSSYTTGRRGVAGTLVVEKIVGAAAEHGLALKPLKVLGDRVNAAHARKETVDIPASKLGQKILEIFKTDGYVEDFRVMKDFSVEGLSSVAVPERVVIPPTKALSAG